MVSKSIIAIYDSNSPIVQSAKEKVMTQAMLSWVLLFEGDRWRYVERVAVAMRDDEPIGIASLAPCDEEGNNGPQVIGVWVAPEWRKQGIGVQLVKTLAEESQKLYGQAATIYGVSVGGQALVQAIAKENIQIKAKSFPLALTNLP